VVAQFPCRHEDTIRKLLVMLVPLLGRQEYLAQVVHCPLDVVSFSFFGSLADEDRANHLIRSGDVQQ
jgi:hypothetical protein